MGKWHQGFIASFAFLVDMIVIATIFTIIIIIIMIIIIVITITIIVDMRIEMMIITIHLFIDAKIIGKVKFGNCPNEFNKTKVGEVFWAIDCELTSPVEEHFDTDLWWQLGNDCIH